MRRRIRDIGPWQAETARAATHRATRGSRKCTAAKRLRSGRARSIAGLFGSPNRSNMTGPSGIQPTVTSRQTLFAATLRAVATAHDRVQSPSDREAPRHETPITV